MAWIELHEELRDHPKIKRLAKDMGASKAEARGWVIGLWLWSATYAENGRLTGMDAEEISDACDYEGNEPEKLLGALIERGLVDRNGDELTIHDWEKHGLRLLESNRERQKKFRERVDREADRGEPEPKPQCEDVTLQKRYANVDVTPTIPNHTIPNQKATAVETRESENPAAAAVQIEKHPEKRDAMAIVTQLAGEKRVQDFSWLPGYLLEQWGQEGRVGLAIREELVTLGKKHGHDALRRAIHEAAMHNAKKVAYVRGILEPKAKPDTTAVPSGFEKLKKCRDCGTEWDWRKTSLSLCPKCHPIRKAE
jgi:hypothetical protein